MNDIEREDGIGQARLSLKALLKASLIAGLIVFALPGGGLWISHETGFATMGRVMTSSAVGGAVLQVVLSLAYGAVIASLVWHQRTWVSVIIGPAAGLALYGVNYAFIRPVVPMGNEVHALLSHLFFGLLFALLYRALAVPTVDEMAEHDEHHRGAH